jgi:thiamine-phosphate pyrophosphorylase
VQDLQKIVEQSSIKIFALGGIISEQEVEQIAQSGVYGFSSIRYFY